MQSLATVCTIMNQNERNGEKINEARWREAQVEAITRVSQVISNLIDQMERINEEVENEGKYFYGILLNFIFYILIRTNDP